MKLLTTTLVLLFCHCGLVYSQPFYKDYNPSKENKSQTGSEIDLKGYSTTGFDLSAKQLPSQYLGHNLGVVYLKLSQLKATTEKKDEFETTSDFKKRIESEFKKPILGPLTLTSIFAFKAKGTNTSYDADNQQLAVTCELSPVFVQNLSTEKIPEGLESVNWESEVIDRGSYEGTNAFGATVEVSREEFYRYELALSNYDDFPTKKSSDGGFERVSFTTHLNVLPEQARIMKTSIGTLFISKLTTPFSLTNANYSAATFTSPLSTTTITFYVFANLIEIWFYDIDTGRILSKIKK